MSTARAALVWSPFADSASARKVAAQLVGEQLVACANILPAVESVFHWNDAVQFETEVGVLFKTDADRLDQAVERLGQLHPYDTPVIMGWYVDSTTSDTLAWLGSTLAQGGET